MLIFNYLLITWQRSTKCYIFWLKISLNGSLQTPYLRAQTCRLTRDLTLFHPPRVSCSAHYGWFCVQLGVKTTALRHSNIHSKSTRRTRPRKKKHRLAGHRFPPWGRRRRPATVAYVLRAFLSTINTELPFHLSKHSEKAIHPLRFIYSDAGWIIMPSRCHASGRARLWNQAAGRRQPVSRLFDRQMSAPSAQIISHCGFILQVLSEWVFPSAYQRVQSAFSCYFFA